jgi:hypothetical protein
MSGKITKAAGGGKQMLTTGKIQMAPEWIAARTMDGYVTFKY